MVPEVAGKLLQHGCENASGALQISSGHHSEEINDSSSSSWARFLCLSDSLERQGFLVLLWLSALFKLYQWVRQEEEVWGGRDADSC